MGTKQYIPTEKEIEEFLDKVTEGISLVYPDSYKHKREVQLLRFRRNLYKANMDQIPDDPDDPWTWSFYEGQEADSLIIECLFAINEKKGESPEKWIPRLESERAYYSSELEHYDSIDTYGMDELNDTIDNLRHKLISSILMLAYCKYELREKALDQQKLPRQKNAFRDLYDRGFGPFIEEGWLVAVEINGTVKLKNDYGKFDDLIDAMVASGHRMPRSKDISDLIATKECGEYRFYPYDTVKRYRTKANNRIAKKG